MRCPTEAIILGTVVLYCPWLHCAFALVELLLDRQSLATCQDCLWTLLKPQAWRRLGQLATELGTTGPDSGERETDHAPNGSQRATRTCLAEPKLQWLRLEESAPLLEESLKLHTRDD